MHVQPSSTFARALRLLAAFALLAALFPTLRATPTYAAPTTLWYNGDANGVNGLANENNTGISQAAVYDDFVVPAGGATLSGAFSNNLMNFTGVTQATWAIRSGLSQGNGGTVVASGTSAATQTATGRSAFGFTEYRVEVGSLNLALTAGTYWLSVAPIGFGSGRSFVSSTSGANSVGTPAGNNANAFFNSSHFGSTFASTTAPSVGNQADFSLGVIGELPPAIVLTPNSGLSTSEAGATASFAVRLNSFPANEVTVSLASSKPGEGQPSVNTLTFTPSDALTPQTVTVTGQNDAVDDGDQSYTVTATATSDDGNYSNLSASASLVNGDNDTAAVIASFAGAAETTEAGDTAQLDVVLASQPLSNVVIPVSSLDVSEGVVSAASLTFTPANWSQLQSVVVTGVNDFVDDRDQSYSVRLATPTGDAAYSGLASQDFALVNRDNDTAAVGIFPTRGSTTEAGGAATFSVLLASEPSGPVTINFSSSNSAEGTVAPATLTFTPANWNGVRTLTATGVDDFVDDGDKEYTIVTTNAASSDPDYSNFDVADLELVNRDDDGVGFVVSAVSGNTSEAGGSATFTVRLASQPADSVSFGVASLDNSEGTAAPTSLSFTTANWNVAQTVTVTGVDDDEADDDQSYTVALQPATSNDPQYNNLDAGDVALVNQDNDIASVTVSAPSSPTTSEAGAQSSFTLRLTSKPSAPVNLTVTSSDPAEGAVAPASLTFTGANWNVTQTITVTGQNDDVDDDDAPYLVSITTASSDNDYNALSVNDVALTNTDDDTAGITVEAPALLETAEDGEFDLFTVVLDSQPADGASVLIPLSSDNEDEGTLAPSFLLFDDSNWDQPQTIRVEGQDDDVADGDINYTIVLESAISDDPKYGDSLGQGVGQQFNGVAAIDPADLPAINYDDDAVGVTLDPLGGTATSETGQSVTVDVTLDSQPLGPVDVSLVSSNPAEGTVAPATLNFTSENWDDPQQVVVSGVDELNDDGDQSYTLTATTSSPSANGGDPAYNGLTDVVNLTNIDNDGAGVTLTLRNNGATLGATTSEAGASLVYDVVLNSQPAGAASVTIPFSSSDTGEGTVLPASLTFSAANWNVAQQVTVTGVDDSIDDGDVAYLLVVGAATSADPKYNGENPADKSLLNIDDDNANVTVSPTDNLTVTEAGSTASFAVALTSEPTANVTIELSSSDSSEGTVAPASLTFTAANWQTAQTATITGVNDDLDDGDVSYSIITGASSDDERYAGLQIADVAVATADDDTASVTVAPTTGLTTGEAGSSASFGISLGAQPLSSVRVTLTSSDTSEGAATQAALVFTPANWSTPQTATIVGRDDDEQDGDIAYTIVTALQTNAPVYIGINPADVSLTNLDNDSAGLLVTPAADLGTTEAGGTASFTVALRSQPVADVAVALASSDPSEGTVAPATLSFTPANWNSPQTVTVTGIDDATKDGDIAYTVRVETNTSDPRYAATSPVEVSLINQDNDVPGAFFAPTSELTTSEKGATASFTVALRSQPVANVTLTLASSDPSEGAVTPATLSFTPANWSTPQTATVAGVDDTLGDGDIHYSILTTFQSADPAYAATNPEDVAVINLNDDYYVYLPLQTRPASDLPDLVVTAIRFVDTRLEIVVTNQGPRAVENPFWVDFYINPRVPPMQVNQTWDQIGQRGMVWGITDSALPLAPGASLTLSPGDTHYVAERSRPGALLEDGDLIFVQVDSANTNGTKGGVEEQDELPGRVYNNIRRAVATGAFELIVDPIGPPPAPVDLIALPARAPDNGR